MQRQILNDSSHETMLQQSAAYLTALLVALKAPPRKRVNPLFDRSESYVDYVFYLWKKVELILKENDDIYQLIDHIIDNLEPGLSQEIITGFKRLFVAQEENDCDTYFRLQLRYTFSQVKMNELEKQLKLASMSSSEADSTGGTTEYLTIPPKKPKKYKKNEEVSESLGTSEDKVIVIRTKTEYQKAEAKRAREEAERQARELVEAEAKRAQEAEAKRVQEEAEAKRAREAEAKRAQEEAEAKRAREEAEKQAAEKRAKEEAEARRVQIEAEKQAHEQKLQAAAAHKQLELEETEKRLEIEKNQAKENQATSGDAHRAEEEKQDQSADVLPSAALVAKHMGYSKKVLKKNLNAEVVKLELRVKNVKDHEYKDKESKDNLAKVAKSWFNVWCHKKKIEALQNPEILQLGWLLISHILACIDGGMSEFLAYQEFHNANKEKLDSPSWRDATFFEAVQKKIQENQAQSSKSSDASEHVEVIAIAKEKLPNARAELTEALEALKKEANLNFSICSNHYFIKRALRSQTQSLYEEYVELNQMTKNGTSLLEDKEIPILTQLVQATTTLKRTSFEYMDSPQEEEKERAYSNALDNYNQSLEAFAKSSAGAKQTQKRNATYNSCKYFAIAIIGAVLAVASMALIIAHPVSAPIGLVGLKISFDMLMLGVSVVGALMFEVGMHKDEQRLMNKNRLFSNDLELYATARAVSPARSLAK